MIPSSSIVELITQHDLFRGFSQSLIEKVVQQSEIRQLTAGEVLIEYGQQNSTLYVLIEGALQIILEKEDTQFSISIEPGECIGEMSLVEEKPTSAKAVAYQASQVLAISDAVFWEHLAVSRQGVKNLMRMMADRLHRNNEALIKKIAAQMQYDQLERDLETAGKIQANIVPDGSNLLPGRSELDVFACSRPARAVGGDFYDALALDQDHIYLAIGDATGKGMPAALFMMRTFTSLRFLVSNYPSFADVMPALNNTLARKNEDMMFASIWAGILNVRTGILQCVNGGHHPPYARLGGEPFALLPPPNGPIVGVVEDAQFELANLQLQAGDTIFLYTDGLPEALSPEQEAFEAERILAALNRRPNTSLHDLIHEVQTQVDSFVQNAPTHDDLTMLAFRYNGHEGNSRG